MSVDRVVSRRDTSGVLAQVSLDGYTRPSCLDRKHPRVLSSLPGLRTVSTVQPTRSGMDRETS